MYLAIWVIDFFISAIIMRWTFRIDKFVKLQE